MLLGFAAALGAAVAFGVAAILQAIAARRERTIHGLDLLLLVRMLRHPAFLVALLLNAGGFVLHLLALRSLPLFLVQSVIAGSAAVTALLSAVWLHLPFTVAERRGVVAVVVGLALLSTTAAEAPSAATTPAERALLLVVCALIAAAGLVAGRVHGARGAALLGLLAGCAFAVVAVGGRVALGGGPAGLVRDPAVYALLIAGVLGFLLYSTALQRGAVMTSTSAMVLTQTALPSAVGVLLLGDEVRSGWALVALAGFVLAVGGALTLARNDPLAGITPTPQLRV